MTTDYSRKEYAEQIKLTLITQSIKQIDFNKDGTVKLSTFTRSNPKDPLKNLNWLDELQKSI